MIQRIHIAIRGAVQGVGFRPFVYRLATEMELTGWVLNSPQGVFVEAEGEKKVLESFLLRLQYEKPAPSFIQSMEFSFLDPVDYRCFEIRSSELDGTKSALILPDIAVCAECLAELLDRQNRRYRYPFTNCTHCGPRYSIIESLPYDRPNTSMKSFKMCEECRQEYNKPEDRRFHAQPNACPTCGPHLDLLNPSGKILSSKDDALLEAAEAIRSGKIVAIKGLGGFHLITDACNQQAVETLRIRKHREEKPFALMYPSLELVQADCEVSPLESRLLKSAESPIVLLERRSFSNSRQGIASSVAPHNPYLGVMLPYTPLHHLLLQEIHSPVVATSGNLSDEPICTDEDEALARLRNIADFFLVHNRHIVRHIDDSIVRIILGRELVLRRARGYAPLPLSSRQLASQILAVGGHLKNTVAMTIDDNAFISQHVGDLENKEALDAFHRVIKSFHDLYPDEPGQVAADMHPNYLSSKFAWECGLPVISVQHHFAHVAACMAENQIDGRVLGISWDGTGYGLDGTVWGGEFLLADEVAFARFASFRTYRLPGNESAIREPRRSALGLLYEVFGESVCDCQYMIPVQSFSHTELAVLLQMLQKGINSPWTSSAGRLFDAVASISGLRQRISFEGQAAMELEFALTSESTEENYPFALVDSGTESWTSGADFGQPSARETPPRIVVDWEQMIRAILQDAKAGSSIGKLSRKFHNTLVEIILEVAKLAAAERVVLSGGCFQNKFLNERTVQKLEVHGFKPYWHQRIPPNDGGLALGQLVAASHLLNTRTRLEREDIPQVLRSEKCV